MAGPRTCAWVPVRGRDGYDPFAGWELIHGAHSFPRYCTCEIIPVSQRELTYRCARCALPHSPHYTK